MFLEQKLDEIINSDKVSKINSFLLENISKIIEDIIQITEIPAPTFFETRRLEFVKHYLETDKYKNLKVKTDEFNNIIIRYPGKQKIAKISFLTHLDTVFPKETTLKVQKIDGYTRLSAPGIGDNSTSVAVMLNIIKSWINSNYIPPFDVLFVGNSCEEGLGDLKGTKGFINSYCTRKDVDLSAFLALDGTLDRITHVGTGVKRFKITIETEGGHSWGDFGKTSSIHILGKIISAVSKIKVPLEPKTTYNVGLIEGGTSINTIAQKSSMFVDLRSQDSSELRKLEKKLLKIIKNFTKESEIKTTIEVVGDRPSGSIPKSHPIVKITKEVGNRFNVDSEYSIASTDANIPLSKNIPAIAIGCYSGYGAHTLNEFIEIDSLKKGIPYANSALISIIEWIQFSQ